MPELRELGSRWWSQSGMEMPAWLDVALEGGLTELQHALVEYRQLRASLQGRWQERAAHVAQLATHAHARLSHVEGATVRAKRRAEIDENADEVHVLLNELERARAALEKTLGQVHGRACSFADQLEWLGRVATEASAFESAVRRCHLERVGWTTFFLAMVFGGPFAMWHAASFGGRVPTYLTADGLAEPVAGQVVLAVLLALALCAVRLHRWTWLGTALPLVLSPSVVGVTGGLVTMTVFLSFALNTLVPVSVGLLVVVLVGAPALMRAWWAWRPPVDVS